MEKADLIANGMTEEQATAFMATMQKTVSVSKDSDGNYLPVNGILVLPKEVADNVKASEMGGWFPPYPVTASKAVWLSAAEHKKTRTGTDDVIVRFRVGDVSCKTYLSTLKGLWNELRTAKKVEGEFLKEDGSFRDTIILAYTKQEGNTQYPLRLEMLNR